MLISTSVKLFFFTLVFIAAHRFQGTAQPFQAIHVNIVPTNNVRCVFFDRDGFMWIGSNLGLARYDGTTAIDIKQINPIPEFDQ